MGKKLTLCVFVDAFGWELAQRHPFLDDIVSVKTPLGTIFGYSSTCDPTILTGKMPRDHGHFTFFTYDPANSPFKHYKYFGLLPKFIMERGRVRGKLSQIMKSFHGFTGYFQLYNMPFRYLHLFDYKERRNIFEPGGINGGQPTIFDYLRENGISYCRPEGFVETESVAEVEQAIAKRSVGFVYLFLGKLDTVLHVHGTRSEEAKGYISWYDSLIRGVYEKATDAYERVHLYVFSDHGMTDTVDTCDLIDRVDRLGLTYGVDYVAAYDSTMARFWFLKAGARERIVGTISEEPRGHIMSDDELVAYGCDFPNREYGELFLLMNPGVLLCPSHMGVKPLAAMHGYAPEDKDSTATFMSNLPASETPKDLADLYTVLRNDVSSNAV